MKTWGTAGKMDPFKDIYDLIFQMSIRMASCDELATDAETVRNISDIYFRHEKSVTAASLLLPWFPSAARKEKTQTITALYKILSHYVDLRRKGEMRNSDTIDVLLTQGGDDASIIDVCLTMSHPHCPLMFHFIVYAAYHIRWCRQHCHDGCVA
jgi:sterol 14-demethylase